jgi:hypothetical protein
MRALDSIKPWTGAQRFPCVNRDRSGVWRRRLRLPNGVETANRTEGEGEKFREM